MLVVRPWLIASGAFVLPLSVIAIQGLTGHISTARAQPAESMKTAGRLSPPALSRSKLEPAELTFGFSSTPVEGVTPPILQMEFELSRHIEFDTSGLPSCPVGSLLSDSLSEECSASFVGHGTVISEVTAFRRKGPVTLTGTLHAFYSAEGGHHRILAQVKTGPPLALTYVIPFTIASAISSRFGKRLIVSKQSMATAVGACFAYHPGCFSSPYTLEGVYSNISKMMMTLGGTFVRGSTTHSFVVASCPVKKPASEDSFPLLRAELQYQHEVYLSHETKGHCSVDGGAAPGKRPL